MSSNENARIHVRLSPSHHTVSFHWADNELVVLHSLHKNKGASRVRSHHIHQKQILRVTYDSRDNTLYVAYLKPKSKKKPVSLVVLKGEVQDVEKDVVETWAQSAMKSIYDDYGSKPFRRLLVFINPHGGSGRATKIFAKTVKPILQAAGCTVKIVETERQGHAFDVVKNTELEYDAIVTVSGDGLVHEVLNGLSQHAQPLKALATPIAPIPAGSGNGLSLNLLGLEDGFCTATAAVNVVKGRPMRIDLFSVTQNGKRSLSFMSQSLGLMADVDLDTEHLRWMGDTRFVYGYIRGVMALEPCPIELSVKVAERDKDKMAETAHARNQERDALKSEGNDEKVSEAQSVLPVLKYLPDDNDGWFTIDGPMSFVYAGQGPYVSRDYMAFPVSLPDDGLIDIAAMQLTTRKDALANISTAPTGESFWLPKLHYYKAHAYRVKTLSKKGNLSIDGERFPFEEFQVEVHPSLGTLLSPYGKYIADFKPRRPTQTVQ